MLIVLCEEAIDPVRFRPQVLTIFLWAVVSVTVQFSKALQTSSLDWSGVYAIQWPIWYMGIDLSLHFSVFGLVFSFRSIHVPLPLCDVFCTSWFIGPLFQYQDPSSRRTKRISIKGSLPPL